MPSKSAAQHRLMEGAAHDPAFAKKVGVPQSVGKEFAEADKATGKFNKHKSRLSRMYKSPSSKGKE